jgi:thioredoxin 1
MKHISDGEFKDEVLKSEVPVLVDFWAEWCMPCRMIAPVLEELESEYTDKLKIVKMNVDENPLIPTTYGITAIPTLILFKNGEIAKMVVGLRSKSDLKKIIDEVLE